MQLRTFAVKASKTLLWINRAFRKRA